LSTIQQPPIEPGDKILMEAERLFRHYGYGKTTMADIADACQMSPANLYRFFASKSALMQGICSRITGDAERILLQIVNSNDTASRRMERFVEANHVNTLENLLDHRRVHEMVVVAMEEQWAAVKAHLARVCQLIERIIEDGIQSGEFRPQDPERAAKTVHAAMACICHPTIVAQKLDDEERATPNEIAELIVRSLKARD
jgi:AcrR family transcriptional regulator